MTLREFHVGALCEPKTQSLGIITRNSNLVANLWTWTLGKHKLILKHFKKRLFSLVCDWNCVLIREIVICVLLFKREVLSHFVYHIVFHVRRSFNQNWYFSCYALETSCYVFIDESVLSLQFSKRRLIFRKKSWQNQSY